MEKAVVSLLQPARKVSGVAGNRTSRGDKPDEFGGFGGLLKLTDIVQAIAGEMPESGEPEPPGAARREDGSWLLDGLMPVGELKVRLGIDDLPEEDRGRYNTVAGLLMSVSGHLPATGERIACGDWLFEVIDLDGKRIDKVLASGLAGPRGHLTGRA